MDRPQILATLRHERGTKACRRLRRQGRIPAVIYGKDREVAALTVTVKDVREILTHHHSGHAILDLLIVDNGTQQTETVLIQHIQRDPVNQEILCVDFLKVSLADKITTTIPVMLTGVATGIKQGGILEHHLHEVTIECLPDDLPDELIVNMTPFGVNSTVHVRDIACPQGITILTDPEEAIAHISPPRLHVEVAEEPVAATEAEPELVKQKGTKEEE